jgi:hypothetical protein
MAFFNVVHFTSRAVPEFNWLRLNSVLIFVFMNFAAFTIALFIINIDDINLLRHDKWEILH